VKRRRSYHCERSEQYHFRFSENITCEANITQKGLYMAESILKDKSKKFAKEIILLCKSVKSPLSNQLLRSGTSIGANIHEVNYAQSKPDFISKLEIALKECHETEYWLELLSETGSVEETQYNNLIDKAGTIRRMLISSCKTAKGNMSDK
jgi:four helix bundle protein